MTRRYFIKKATKKDTPFINDLSLDELNKEIKEQIDRNSEEAEKALRSKIVDPFKEKEEGSDYYWTSPSGEPSKLFRIVSGNIGAMGGALGGAALANALKFKSYNAGAASTLLGWLAGRSLGTFVPEIDSYYGGKRIFPKYKPSKFTFWDYLSGMAT